MWASAEEIAQHFHQTTFATFDFVIRDVWDNDEFLTGATVDLLVRGKVVETESFTVSSEFESYATGGSAAYGNDARGHAASYAWAWIESCERNAEAERLGVHPLEIAFAPFGSEWEREQQEVYA